MFLKAKIFAIQSSISLTIDNPVAKHIVITIDTIHVAKNIFDLLYNLLTSSNCC